MSIMSDKIEEYDLTIKRMKIGMCVSNIVANRFYHQLSFQDNFVIKEYFADPANFYASIVDAILEAIIQHLPELSDDETEKMLQKICDKWGASEEYEDFDGVDIRHDVKKAIQSIQTIAFIACDELTEKQVESAELYPNNDKLGDINQFYWETLTAPYPQHMPHNLKPTNKTRARIKVEPRL